MPFVYLFMMMLACFCRLPTWLSLASSIISAWQALRDSGNISSTIRQPDATESRQYRDLAKLATHHGRWLSDQCEGSAADAPGQMLLHCDWQQ